MQSYKFQYRQQSPHVVTPIYTVYVPDTPYLPIQTVYKQNTNMKRIGFNIPDELAERLDIHCQQNFTNRTEAFKAWIKSLPVEKPMKRKKKIDQTL
jgi:hypothetical protein